MSRLPALLVHIGPGKTGSSAIQQTCETGREALREQGVAWLGMMLEHDAARPLFDWQTPAQAARLFHGMEPDKAADQIHTVLRDALEQLGHGGVRLAVWSHEAIFARREGVGAALQRLRDEDVELRLVTYLRRHDRWARSAYAQWGIRHKTYEGPVMPFADWVAARPVRFADNLRYWNDAFGPALVARNYDATPDVTEDFLDLLGVTGIAPTRTYDTPPPTALAAWAVYNAHQPQPVLPDRFARVFAAAGMRDQGWPALPPPAELFPTDADLAAVLKDAAGDLAAINAVLSQKGQPPFDDTDPTHGPALPSDWEMIQFLMTMVFSQQEQILRLRHRISLLEDGG